MLVNVLLASNLLPIMHPSNLRGDRYAFLVLCAGECVVAQGFRGRLPLTTVEQKTGDQKTYRQTHTHTQQQRSAHTQNTNDTTKAKAKKLGGSANNAGIRPQGSCRALSIHPAGCWLLAGCCPLSPFFFFVCSDLSFLSPLCNEYMLHFFHFHSKNQPHLYRKKANLQRKDNCDHRMETRKEKKKKEIKAEERNRE